MVLNNTHRSICSELTDNNREWLRCAFFILLATSPLLNSACTEVPADARLEVAATAHGTATAGGDSLRHHKMRGCVNGDRDQKTACIARYPLIQPVTHRLCEMTEPEVSLN